MLALSIRQPFAWLIVHGHKDIENRTWRAPPKGRIAIHASRTFDRDGYLWVQQHFPTLKMPLPSDFEFGGIVGMVEHCGSVDEHKSPWFAGPFGHVLKNPRPCRFVRVPGQLRFFDVPAKWIVYIG
jgi:hypothetical protein